MSGGKFDPAGYDTAKPWNPTPTDWADWPTAKEPPPASGRTVLLWAVVVCVVLVVSSFWWLPAAGILGALLALAFMAGR